MDYADRPWLKSYSLGPYKLEHSLLPYPQKPLFEILDRVAQEFPNQTAILFEGKELKYHQLKTRVDRLANALTKLGLAKGDRLRYAERYRDRLHFQYAWRLSLVESHLYRR